MTDRPRDCRRPPAGAARELPKLRTLPRSFYKRAVFEVARDLLGMMLVRDLPGGRRLVGRIVEVEAYDGRRDLACHASKGRTKRTDPMFGEAGRAYVYFVYGMHCCLNVVTGPVDYPAAVLIRAVEPVEGWQWLAARSSEPARIASGPGRVTRAFRVGLSLNRADLCGGGPLRIARGKPAPPRLIARGRRVGVDFAGVWASKPWRFGVRGHPALSRPFGPGQSPTQVIRSVRVRGPSSSARKTDCHAPRRGLPREIGRTSE